MWHYCVALSFHLKILILHAFEDLIFPKVFTEEFYYFSHSLVSNMGLIIESQIL